MTRLWIAGIPLQVGCEGAVLIWFIWTGRKHPVAAVANHWRVDLGWWRLRIWRDYYKLTTETGLLVIVYRDLLTGQWYMQRLYD